MMERQSGVSPTDEYIQDGLLLWLDGINNTLNGHDANATQWDDLTGSGFAFPLIASVHTINANNIHLKEGLWADSEYAHDGLAYCEFVLQKDGTNTKSMVLRPAGNNYTSMWVYSTNSIGFNHGYGDYPRFPVPTERDLLINSVSFPVKFKLTATNEEERKAYFNNELITTINRGSGSWAYSSNKALFCYNGRNQYPFIGKVYAVRFYDRILTDEERLRNWNLDKLRFNIT